MFIVFGTYRHQKQAGQVGDLCARCQKWSRHLVVKHYAIPHLYLIPFMWHLEGQTMLCQDCGHEREHEKNRYLETVPLKECQDLEDESLFERCAPDLARLRRVAATLDQGEESQSIRLCIHAAAIHFGQPKSEVFIQKITDWRSLPADERAALRDLAAEMVEDAAAQERARALVPELADLLKKKVDGAIGGWVALAFLIGALALVLPVLAGLVGETTWPVYALVLVAVVVALALWIRRVTRGYRQRYFEAHLLPSLAAQRISPEAFLRLLSKPLPKLWREISDYQLLWRLRKPLQAFLAERDRLEHDPQ